MWWSLGGQDPKLGAHCSGCRINPSCESLLWWCQVHGSCCCVCLPWLEERRRWSSRRNGDLLSSYGQTKPPFSVPKQHPCPCRASHLELRKLRVADRAKEGIWAIANTLGQTEEHDCVCCSLSRVEVGAPALLGWRWTLLPAWVTKRISEGRRAGEPQLATWRRKQEPQEGSLWAELCPAHPIRPSLGAAQCPWQPPVSVCPSIWDRRRAGQAGWLLWRVCAVPFWMTTRKVLHYIQTSTLGFVTLLLNTATTQ